MRCSRDKRPGAASHAGFAPDPGLQVGIRNNTGFKYNTLFRFRKHNGNFLSQKRLADGVNESEVCRQTCMRRHRCGIRMNGSGICARPRHNSIVERNFTSISPGMA